MVETVPMHSDAEFETVVDQHRVIQVHSKSFSLAARMLPADIRDDVCKLYAWCRWCDNAVDESPSKTIARTRLNRLRSDIELIYDSQSPQLAASQWLAELVDKYDLPKEWPLDLLRGMESDLEFEPVEDQQELELYCYRVAGVVGLMMCRLLGVTDPRAYENANRLGIAMQMTNIARDVAEDWDRGRVYLPQSWVKLSADPNRRPSDGDVQEPVKRLLALADRNYRLGRQGFKSLPTKTRLAIRIAATVYEAIGSEIRAANFCVMGQRHFVSIPKKLLLVVNDVAKECVERCKEAWSLRVNSHRQQSIESQSNQSYNQLASLENDTMRSEFQYLAVFGLSMSLIMSTVLFFLMGMNPKLDSYEAMPWIYSGVSAIGATMLWFWAQRIGKQLDAVENR
ncbi:MAG: phytoene/squalene synthase family protein [Planctomycetota bacterium]